MIWQELAGLVMMAFSAGTAVGLVVLVLVTVLRGAGGQPPPRPDQYARPQPYVPVSPGGTPVIRVHEIIVTPAGTLEGMFTYSSNPPAAGTLIESAGVEAAGTDASGNHFVPGHASYAGNFATSLNAGFIQFYTGSLAGGWTATGSLAADTLGDLALLAASGRSIITNNVTLDDGAGNLSTGGSGTFGSLTVGGSGSTQLGDNGGVTSGPSGTVNAFPAAGPNHTHAEAHHHPF